MLVAGLIILTCLFIFDFTGYITLKKINKSNYTITTPLGFVIFMGIFELISIFPMKYHMNFDIYRIILLTILALTYAFLIFKNQDYFKNFISRMTRRFDLLVFVLSFIFGVILFLNATGLGDSWLYGSMIFSSIDNNQIFSNNGIEVGGTIQSFHYTDGFYLFQSVLTSFVSIDRWLFVTSFIKFLEAFILMSGIGFCIEFFFNKNKSVIFLTVGMMFIVGSPIFTSYVQTDEIYTHTFKSLSMGTNMANNIGVVVILITILSNMSNRVKSYLYPLLILAMFSFTSSALFICGALLFVAIYVEVFGRKDKEGIYPLINGFAVIYLFVYTYIFLSSLTLAVVGIIIGLILYLGSYFLVKHLSYATIRRLLLIGLILFIIGNCVALLIIFDTFNFLDYLIENNHESLYYNSPHYYPNYFGNLLWLALAVVGIYQIYKHNKIFAWYLLFMVIFFANPLSYRTVGSIIQQIVYHRIYALTFMGIIAMIGLGSLINYFDDKFQLNRFKYVYAVLVPLVLFFPSIPQKLSGFSSFVEYKYQSKDIYELANWDFPLTKNVNPGAVLPNGDPDLATDLDTFLRMRGDLTWVDCTSGEPFYLVLPKEQALANKESVFATDNYLVYYIEEEECQISNA